MGEEAPAGVCWTGSGCLPPPKLMEPCVGEELHPPPSIPSSPPSCACGLLGPKLIDVAGKEEVGARGGR